MSRHEADELRRRRLLRAARRGDRGARARLVELHLPLLRSLALRYRDFGLPLDDLVQEGAIGLLEAIERYDPARGAPFEPYARFRIRRAMRNALTNQARLIRLPKHVIERRRALERAEARLVSAGARPTPAALAAATGLSLPAVLEARAATRPLSLDEPLLPDGSTLESVVAHPSAGNLAEGAADRDRVERLTRALTRLPARQQRILSARWGLDGTPRATTELARELALSPRRTQTIGRQALDALRRDLEPEPPARTSSRHVG